MNSISIASNFHRYFSAFLANTDGLKKAVYKLRYRVYCEEFHYEEASKFPDKQERDEFDTFSYHGLIVHKDTGNAAACLRLVPASRLRILPFEKFCNGSFDRDRLSELQMPPSTMCEISRLAVDTNFRRRKGEKSSPIGQTDIFDFSVDQMRSIQLIGISAFLVSIALSELTKRRNSFAVMEPFLPKLLNKAGIPFFKIGSDINYHGKRALYYTRTENALVNMKPELKELYQIIYDSLAPYFIEPRFNHSIDSPYQYNQSHQNRRNI